MIGAQTEAPLLDLPIQSSGASSALCRLLKPFTFFCSAIALVMHLADRATRRDHSVSGPVAATSGAFVTGPQVMPKLSVPHAGSTFALSCR